MRKPLILCLLALVQMAPAAVHVVTDKAGFNAAMRSAVGGDIVDLSGVTFAKVETGLENVSFSPPVTVRNGGFDCWGDGSPQANCYAPDVSGVRFENIGLEGSFNGDRWSNVTWSKCRFSRGRAVDGVILKLQHADNVTIEDSDFTTRAGATDLLVFAASTRIKVLGNRADLTGARALAQVKGGSRDVEVAYNQISNGLRNLQLGGSNDTLNAASTIFDAWVHDNHITGGQACAAFSGFNGIRFERNTCRNPGNFVLRILVEQGGIDPNQNLTVTGNAFLGYAGPEMINISANGPHHFASMGHGPNLYDFAPGSWPSGMVALAPPVIVASGAVSVGAGGVLADPGFAAAFGVTPTAAPPPPAATSGLYWTLDEAGVATQHSSYSDARAAVLASPCNTRLFRAASLSLDLAAMKVVGDLMEIPVEITLPDEDPLASLGCCGDYVPTAPDSPERFNIAALASCCSLACARDDVALRGCACLGGLAAD